MSDYKEDAKEDRVKKVEETLNVKGQFTAKLQS